MMYNTYSYHKVDARGIEESITKMNTNRCTRHPWSDRVESNGRRGHTVTVRVWLLCDSFVTLVVLNYVVGKMCIALVLVRAREAQLCSLFTLSKGTGYMSRVSGTGTLPPLLQLV